MIQAGLLNGAYVSQYDMRATANPGVPQYLEKVPFDFRLLLCQR